MGYETLENNRSKRFAEILAGYDKVSFENFKKIKFNRQYPTPFAFPPNIDSLFLLTPADHTTIADLINNLNRWDKKGNAESIGAGTFLLVYTAINKSLREYLKTNVLNTEQCVDVLTSVRKEMIKSFGRTDLQLGEIQKLVRGDKVIPLPGLPDVLAPMYSVPYKNGMFRGTQGDAYVELVRFTKDGPIIETMNVYGASSKKDSPHYTDQMEMYTHQQTKPMTLNKAEVYKNAERIYHPN